MHRLVYRVTAPTLLVSLLVLGLDMLAGWYLHDMHHRTLQLTLLDVSSMRAAEQLEMRMWDPLESTCRHASLSIL